MATSTEEKKSAGFELKPPDGVIIAKHEYTIKVKGPLGTIEKDFSKVPVNIQVSGGGQVTIAPYRNRRSQIAIANTVRSIITSMFRGVTRGYTYRLKVVYAHFPFSVKVKDDKVLIENFGGERAPRIARILGSCKVTTEGDDVIVKGVSIEDIGQTAANIEQATRVKNKDQRVFLDGVYLYEKKRES